MDKLPDITLLIPYILIGLPLFVLIFVLMRKRSLQAQTIFLIVMWAVGLLLLIINKVSHAIRGEHILAQLPLHLCYFSLIFFIPMALFTKKKVYYDFIFYINSIGALMAIFFPAKDYVDGTWSVITFTYFVFHYIIFVIPLFLFLWKIYTPRITLKQSLIITAILIVLSLAMHVLNLVLVKNGVTAANYFWTLTHNAKQNVAILRTVATVIPYDYIYIMVLAAPALALYITAWNTGLYLWDRRKSKKAV